MPSFDIVVETDLQEVDNAINQAKKELSTRYDFRGSKSRIEWDKKAEIVLIGDDDFKLRAVKDILQTKLSRRGVSLKNLEYSEPESAFEGTLKQKITLQMGIPTEKARSLVKMIKGAKLKVQSAIQDDQVRVTGKKRDDLQTVMGLVKKTYLGLEFKFSNLRD